MNYAFNNVQTMFLKTKYTNYWSKQSNHSVLHIDSLDLKELNTSELNRSD